MPTELLRLNPRSRFWKSYLNLSRQRLRIAKLSSEIFLFKVTSGLVIKAHHLNIL